MQSMILIQTMPESRAISRAVDLNSDLGEGVGPFHAGEDMDASLFPLISSANVACGFHAGDPLTIARTVSLARKYDVAVGAHPGFHDLVGFGRRVIAASPQEIEANVLYQLGAVAAFCRAEGVPLRHVKAHGALYNLASKDRSVADAIARAVVRFDHALVFFALSGSELVAAGEAAGLRVCREAFADRAYNADGSLVARAIPGSVLTDPNEVAVRIVQLVETGSIGTIDGGTLHLAADTICIHSDTSTAVPIAREIRAQFDRAGISVRPFNG